MQLNARETKQELYLLGCAAGVVRSYDLQRANRRTLILATLGVTAILLTVAFADLSKSAAETVASTQRVTRFLTVRISAIRSSITRFLARFAF